jgi:hypothetical protein
MKTVESNMLAYTVRYSGWGWAGWGQFGSACDSMTHHQP